MRRTRSGYDGAGRACLDRLAGRSRRSFGHALDDGFDAVPAGGDDLAVHPELEAQVVRAGLARSQVKDRRIAVALSFDAQLLDSLAQHLQGAGRRKHHPHRLPNDCLHRLRIRAVRRRRHRQPDDHGEAASDLHAGRELDVGVTGCHGWRRRIAGLLVSSSFVASVVVLVSSAMTSVSRSRA